MKAIYKPRSVSVSATAGRDKVKLKQLFQAGNNPAH